jgi:LysM repeat protein
MNNDNQGRRIVIRAETIAIGLIALAVVALVAVATVAVGFKLAERDPAESLETPVIGTSTPVIAGLDVTPTPPVDATSSGPRVHTVQEGETLIGIASQYNIPLDLLQSANHLKNPEILFPGQQLVIPDTTILTQVIPIGTAPPSPTPTLPSEEEVNLSVLSGWPRSLADGTPDQLQANYPLMVERPRFRVHFQPGTYPERHIDEIIDRIERALGKVEARLGVQLAGTFDVYAAGTLFEGNDAHLRGQSRSRDRRLFFLSDGTGTPAENDYVVTHELTHLISWNTWGTPSSTMLSEGLATYVGKAELENGGFMPYEQLCLGIVTAGELPSMALMDRDFHYFQGHIEDRFNYFGSACFVQYLVQTYGLQPMSQLYHSSDYMALYGKSLPDLDQEWRTSELARQSQMIIDPAALVSYTQEVTSVYGYVFNNLNDTATSHQAYLAVDQARIALWKGDYASVRLWLDNVYQLTGLTPQAVTR